MSKTGKIRIGTSGWSYGHWKGPFYAADIADDLMLEAYSERLDSVEINRSFYSLPDESTLESWRDATPRDFLFAVKASRYITHMKKLNDPEESTRRLFGRLRALGPKLGPVLFQLPPDWRCDTGRLDAFLAELDPELRYTVEFRDRSWLNEEVYEILASHDAALCIYELDGFVSPKELTADFVYVRLHGPGGPYRGDYSRADLAGWSGAFSAWARQGCDVYCFFDNDEKGYAPNNAAALKEMLARVAEQAGGA